MAPKQTKRAAEPKEKAGAKKKAKAAKAAKPQESSPAEPSGVVAVPEPLVPTREETSGFLTALKYKAKNPKDPSREGAAAILEVG